MINYEIRGAKYELRRVTEGVHLLYKSGPTVL